MAFEIIESNQVHNYVKLSKVEGRAGLWHTSQSSDSKQIAAFKADSVESIKIDTELKKPSANVKFTDGTFFTFPLRGEFAGWLGSVMCGSMDDIEAHIAPHSESQLALFMAIGYMLGERAKLSMLSCKVLGSFENKKGVSPNLSIWGEWFIDNEKAFKISQLWEKVEGGDKSRLRSLASILKEIDPVMPALDLRGEVGDLPF